MSITRRDLFRLGALAGAAALSTHVLGAAPPAPAAARPLRILILGGTGFLGPHQVRYALSRGHTVTLFNRGRRPQEWPAEVEQLTGDRNEGALDALKGREWDVCIDNPTSIPFWVRDVGKVLKGKVGQYVFVSTISVYAASTAVDADESAPLATYEGKDVMKETQASLRANMGLYGPLKAACEREAQKRFGDRSTIVRPGLIVGPGDESDRFTYWPVRLAAGGDVVAPGDGSDPVQFIDARDLAEWMIRLVEAKGTGVYNATGPDYTMRTDAMLYGIRATTTAGARLHWLPADFLEAQKVAPWRDMPVWLPGTGETAGFARRSIARAVGAGLTFRPLAATAADTLAWFRQQPAERQAKLGAGLTKEREAEVLKAWQAKATG